MENSQLANENANSLKDFFSNLEDSIVKFSISPLTAWFKLASDPKAPESWVKSTEYYALLAALPILLPTTWVLAKAASFAISGSEKLLNSLTDSVNKLTESSSATEEANKTSENVENKEATVENMASSTAKIQAVVGHSQRRKKAHHANVHNHHSTAANTTPHKKLNEVKHDEHEFHHDAEPKVAYGMRR